MLVLTTVFDNIQVSLDAPITTNPVDCLTTWRDITTTTYIPGRTPTRISSTALNIVPAPQDNIQRVVDHITIFNADTKNATVTIKFIVNATEHILFKTTLAPGEVIEYNEGNGFRVINTAGAVKGTITQGNNPTTSVTSAVVLGGDVINNNSVANTIADVTGLSFPVTAGRTYYFRFVIRYTAAATTTGSRWSINGPGSPTFLAYRSRWGLTAAATSGTDVMTECNCIAYDTPTASNASSPATTGNVAVIEGIITPSADGSVIARFASEITNSAITAKAGSVVYYHQVA